MPYSSYFCCRTAGLIGLQIVGSEWFNWPYVFFQGLPPRDLDILSSVTFTPHRAQIGAREGKLLVRMENLRALIAPDHVIFFGGRFAR
jgi:hypothetical protein